MTISMILTIITLGLTVLGWIIKNRRKKVDPVTPRKWLG